MKIKVKITSDKNAKHYRVSKGSTVEIDLQDYLCGVVASEVGNSHIEVCKAQAVASRTMAYPYYSCGKTISDSSSSVQCFNAERLDSKVYPNAFSAVEQTEGELLYYNGKVIVPASFSSSNGGRTVSSQERWGGTRAWLIAKDDPWDQGTKTGHGVGMSQRGAKYAAAQGIGYREILSFYYTGTTIGISGKEENVMATTASTSTVTAEKFVESAKYIKNNYKVTYKLGYSGKYDESSKRYLCDCRGYVMWALRRLGISISCIGTNYMSRFQMSSIKEIGSASDLAPGMVVFKSKTSGASGYALPSSYKKGASRYSETIGIRDVYHVGIVISTSPLLIYHCGSNPIRVDSAIGNWNLAGWIKWVEPKASTATSGVTADAVTTTSSADYPMDGTVKTASGRLNFREKPSKSGAIIARLDSGTQIKVLASESSDWYKIQYDGNTGYVMKEFVVV